MVAGRPPGLELDPDSKAEVRHHTTEIGSRGRIYLPPWLIAELDWLTPASRVLAVFDEPGLIRLLPWSPLGESVVASQKELEAQGDLEAIALLQDRYKAVHMPSDSRPVIGDSALLHLGLTELRRPHVYLTRVGSSFRIMSPRYRNSELARARSGFTSLP